MTARVLLTLVLTLVPAVASACPSCLYSAYGDRTFNWAFLGLIAMPFVVSAGIGGALLYRHRLLLSSSRGPHASGSSGAARLALSSEPSHRSSRGPHASGSSGAARLALSSEERP